jgi:hypothetical protein
MDCQWSISAGNGNRVVVDVREYIIEDGEGPECVYDFLQFFDGWFMLCTFSGFALEFKYYMYSLITEGDKKGFHFFFHFCRKCFGNDLLSAEN